ncbi:polysaccharide biosynthesis/export family protein [Zunongwangia sp. F260]|uniref:Polysaccharide biosynthesis/export family protein n=1 Tax=Autumnicola lenta TaxID=3075593 RepID=A0ABU3CIA4_9FLAO|nr:polysaccharide biosynthesis/export family protein [Zunongwangia sp. F260]MDT0646074.1 polysaccharide biosynthesis/export family protein [Zunongwangia sp. F260]
MKKVPALICLLILIFSCSGSRDLVYFSDLGGESVYTERITSNAKKPNVKPGDLLDITVTSLNPLANAPFNRGTLPSVGSARNTASSENTTQGYLVDYSGRIDFPVLGSIEVAGLSKSQVKEKLRGMLTDYLTEPVINIRYLNYSITVVGEVKNPSTFIVPSEKISIVEALGMAGDMTVYGKRDNVLVIREAEGERSMIRLNLNNKDVLNSPYFYLQPDDVVYVEPVKSKKEQASVTRNNISLLLSVISVLSIFIIYLN